jgi:hypothetical protein
VDKLHLHLNQVDSLGKITFADLAHHYSDHELVEHRESVHPKAYTTIAGPVDEWACRKARPRGRLSRYTPCCPNSCCAGIGGHPIRSRATGFSLQSG